MAFEQGHIYKLGFTYKWPGKPWWERYLTFVFLKEADRDYLWKLSLQFWKPPPLPEIPSELNIEFFGFEPRKVASFAREGLWFGPRGQTKFYEWGEIARLLIVRVERDCHDFQKLETTLPDQIMTLRVTKDRPNWSGAPPDVIARMLQRYVAAEQTELFALTGALASRTEATYRLDDFKRRTSGFWQARAIVRSLVVITLAGFAVGIFKLAVALFLLGLCSLNLLVFRRTQKYYTKEQHELEAQIAKFAPAATAYASQEASIS
jgi:hypothetical protein